MHKVGREADGVGWRMSAQTWCQRLVEWPSGEAERADASIVDWPSAWMLRPVERHVRPRLFAFVVVIGRKLPAEGKERAGVDARWNARARKAVSEGGTQGPSPEFLNEMDEDEDVASGERYADDAGQDGDQPLEALEGHQAGSVSGAT